MSHNFFFLSYSLAKIRLFLITSKVLGKNTWKGWGEKIGGSPPFREPPIEYCCFDDQTKDYYSLISQWPPNVEEPTRSILFWAFSFSICFCIALALIASLSTSSCLVIYGLSFINSKTFSIVFGDPVWPPVWPPVSLGIGNRSSTSCNSYLLKFLKFCPTRPEGAEAPSPGHRPG